MVVHGVNQAKFINLTGFTQSIKVGVQQAHIVALIRLNQGEARTRNDNIAAIGADKSTGKGEISPTS